MIGGAIEAIRLNAANLPVEQAIALMPKATLFALAVNELILPLVVAAVITLAVIAYLHHISHRVIAGLTERAVKREVARRLALASGNADDATDAATHERKFTPEWSRGLWDRARRLWEGIPGNSWVVLAVYVVLIVFVVQTSLITFAWIPTYVVQIRLQGPIMEAAFQGRTSRRRELALLGVLLCSVSGTNSLLGEVAQPGPLPRALVAVAGQAAPTRGAFVAETSDGVYVGVRGQLILISERLVDRLTITNAPTQKPAKAETIWQRLQ
jgi:hypothetical protein